MPPASLSRLCFDVRLLPNEIDDAPGLQESEDAGTCNHERVVFIE